MPIQSISEFMLTSKVARFIISNMIRATVQVQQIGIDPPATNWIDLPGTQYQVQVRLPTSPLFAQVEVPCTERYLQVRYCTWAGLRGVDLEGLMRAQNLTEGPGRRIRGRISGQTQEDVTRQNLDATRRNLTYTTQNPLGMFPAYFLYLFR